MAKQIFRVDESMVVHTCCWGSAVVRDCEMGEGAYGKDVEVVCECLAENAELICNALNQYEQTH